MHKQDVARRQDRRLKAHTHGQRALEHLQRRVLGQIPARQRRMNVKRLERGEGFRARAGARGVSDVSGYVGRVRGRICILAEEEK